MPVLATPPPYSRTDTDSSSSMSQFSPINAPLPYVGSEAEDDSHQSPDVSRTSFFGSVVSNATSAVHNWLSNTGTPAPQGVNGEEAGMNGDAMNTKGSGNEGKEIEEATQMSRKKTPKKTRRSEVPDSQGIESEKIQDKGGMAQQNDGAAAIASATAPAASHANGTAETPSRRKSKRDKGKGRADGKTFQVDGANTQQSKDGTVTAPAASAPAAPQEGNATEPPKETKRKRGKEVGKRKEKGSNAKDDGKKKQKRDGAEALEKAKKKSGQLSEEAQSSLIKMAQAGYMAIEDENERLKAMIAQKDCELEYYKRRDEIATGAFGLMGASRRFAEAAVMLKRGY